MRVHIYSACQVDIHVQVLHIQIYCFEANNTKLPHCIDRKYFPCVSLNIQPNQEHPKRKL